MMLEDPKAAAGCDGTRHWAATYDLLTPRRSKAKRLTVYDQDELQQSADLGDTIDNIPAWYCWAPLHRFLALIVCRSFHRAEIHRAIALSSGLVQIGPAFVLNQQHAASSNPDCSFPTIGWSFTVAVNSSDIGILRIDLAKHRRPGTGPEPQAPAFGDYSMTCENADDVSTETFERLVNYEEYAGESTEFFDAETISQNPRRRS